MRGKSDTTKNTPQEREIVRLRMDELTMYEQNAKRHPPEQVKQIAKSIKKFGDNVPIGIWGEKNIIVDGHGRYLAKKMLGDEYANCVRLDHMTDNERRAYTLAVNKIALNSGLDSRVTQLELQSIVSINMTDFGFKPPEVDMGYYGDARERTDNEYNLRFFHATKASGYWQIPTLERCNHVPRDLIGFNYALSSTDERAGVHFFIDDYQFERVWKQPEKYMKILSRFDCVLTPDFSLYMDMPRCMKLWNIYRSRLMGQIWQNAGMRVIPTVSWAGADTYDFCFEGIPEGGTVAISTVGVMRSREAQAIWRDGVDEMIKRVRPHAVILYGKAIEYDWQGIQTARIEPKSFRKGER